MTLETTASHSSPLDLSPEITSEMTPEVGSEIREPLPPIKAPPLTGETLIDFAVTEITTMILAASFTGKDPKMTSLLMEGMTNMSARLAAHFLPKTRGINRGEDNPHFIALFQKTVERRVLTFLEELNDE